MLLQTMLKTYRLQYRFTQEQVANKLFVSTQAVSKWESGESIPSIDNLLALSDLYNVSLDKLIQGSPFFKKPYTVGAAYTKWKLLSFILMLLIFYPILILSDMMPIFLIVVFTILAFVFWFPMLFGDYWIIKTTQIDIKHYSQHTIEKFKQILFHRKEIVSLTYEDITSVEIIYKKKIRNSPFDVLPDDYHLELSDKHHTYCVPLDHKTKDFLPQFIGLLTRKNVKVIDKDNILNVIIEGKSVYEHFHPET